MSLFPNPSRPRSLKDICVGKSHMVEILFHLRRCDYDWYIDNSTIIDEEIFDLLSEKIIPRMFGDIIERYHAKRHPELFPDIIVDDNAIVVGSKNMAKTTNKKSKQQQQQQQQRKKKKGGGSTKGKKSSSASSPISSNDNKKPEKDVYFSFGETVQLAYRKEPLSSPPIRTIFFKGDNKNKDDNDEADDDNRNDSKQKGGNRKSDNNKTRNKKRQLKDDDEQKKNKKQRRSEQRQQQGPIVLNMESRIKLPSKLLIWVSQIVDPNNKTNPDPSNVGFYRPEMIPMCDLFREPKDEEEMDE